MADKKITLLIEAILADKKFRAAVARMGNETEKHAKKQKSFFKQIKAGWLAVGVAIFKVARGIQSFIGIAKNFESAIARVASVTGEKALPALKKFAREAAVATKFTAKEAADALFFLASAGLKVSEMGEVLTPALNLAAAANLEIGEAADLVVGQLKTYGAEMSKATNFVDIMTKTNQVANTDVRQLGEALKFASSTASLAGVSFEDLNAMVGALADLGIKGGKAGVQLRMAFVRLLNPTEQAAKALAKYDISLKEVNELLPTPIKLFERMSEAGISTGDAFKIFGVRQAGVIKLMKSSIPRMKELAAATKDAGGAAKKAADIQMDTLEGKTKLLKSAVDELVLSISSGAGMIPALKNLVGRMVDVVRKTAEWINETQAIRRALSGLSAVFKTISFTFLLGAKNISVGFEFIKTQLDALIVGFQGMGKIMRAVANRDWKELKNASTNVLKEMGKKQDEFKQNTIEDYEGIKELAISAYNDILEASKINNEKIIEDNQAMTDAVDEDMNAHVLLWKALEDAKVKATKKTLKQIVSDNEDALEEIKKFYEAFTKAIEGFASDQFTAEKNKLDAITEETEKRFDATSQAAKDFFELEKREAQEAFDAMTPLEQEAFLIKQKYEEEKALAVEEATKKQRKIVREAAEKEKKIKTALAVIDSAAAVIKTMASVPFPFNIPLAAAQTAAGLKRVELIRNTPIPEFAKGINELLSDTMAQLHKGERVVPAHLNIPSLSNEAFAGAAMQGIASRGSNVNQDNRTYGGDTNSITNTFNVPEGSVGIEDVMEYASRTGGRFLRR
jgi:TP901 family phage tail tape measure protein